jgi:hypothetical protein
MPIPTTIDDDRESINHFQIILLCEHPVLELMHG